MPKEKQICPIHNKPLKYSRKLKMWYCSDCLFSAHLTYLAQREAVKRYRRTEKGKEAEEKYEKSAKGKLARDRYLKSEKYKLRRKEYNQRLKESLQIARAVLTESATREKVEEKQRTEELLPLIQDIREYADTLGKLPSTHEVAKWAKDTYGLDLSPSRVTELLHKASKRR